jgi:uncharacterized Ntn-hydrolase superfamily protein
MTFSIVARAPGAAGTDLQYGIAIASSSPAVAARCAHAQAGAGAVATQNVTDPALGPRMLAAMAAGASAADALASALQSTPYGEYRQLLAIGRDGPPAAHTGGRALGTHAFALGRDAAAAGNLLAGTGVPAAMLEAFGLAGGALAERLLQALRAGLAAGGEAGPVRSAGLLVVHEVSWPIIDLRVDWDAQDPVAALERLYAIYAPQVADYVDRAVNPTRAPSYGVPGDP